MQYSHYYRSSLVIVDLAMGQISCSTERISSCYIYSVFSPNKHLPWFARIHLLLVLLHMLNFYAFSLEYFAFYVFSSIVGLSVFTIINIKIQHSFVISHA